MNSQSTHLERQIRLSKWLSLGFVLTIWPMAWATSGIAFILGVWAMGTIRESQEPLAGKIIAWWCIIVGGIQCLWYIRVIWKLIEFSMKE